MTASDRAHWLPIHVPLELADRPRAFEECVWRTRGMAVRLSVLRGYLRDEHGHRSPPPPIVLVDSFWMSKLYPEDRLEEHAAQASSALGGDAHDWRSWLGCFAIRQMSSPDFDPLRLSVSYGISADAVVLFVCPERLVARSAWIAGEREEDPNGAVLDGVLASGLLAFGSAALSSEAVPLDALRQAERLLDGLLSAAWLSHGSIASFSASAHQSYEARFALAELAMSGFEFDYFPRQYHIEETLPKDQVGDGWERLVETLRRQNVVVRFISSCPPESLPGAQGHPRELEFIEKPPAERGNSATDALGLYVRDESGRTLPAGIHLFKCRIDAAQRENTDPGYAGTATTEHLLAWAVFWHELTHLAVDRRAAHLPRTPLALQSVRLDEPFCELAALLALETGGHALLPLRGPIFSDAWLFERWRLRQRTVPYHYFGALAPAFAEDMDSACRSVVAYLQIAPDAVDGWVAPRRRNWARKIVQECCELQWGRVPPEDDVGLVRRLARSARTAVGTTRPAEPIVVYIWCGVER